MVTQEGTVGASSFHGINHEPINAFIDNALPWASRSNQIPALVWKRFQRPVKVAKVGIYNRLSCCPIRCGDCFKQSPRAFQVIASSDCSDWTTLLIVENADFTKPNQLKTWLIPEERRSSFACVGLKVFSTIGSHWVGIRLIQFYEAP